MDTTGVSRVSDLGRNDDELSPAEERLRELHRLLAPPGADEGLTDAVVRAARRQSALRGFLFTFGVFGSAWLDTVAVLLGLRGKRRG